MKYGLHGRTALVTGADSGIGFHTAAALLQEGAAVLLSGTVPERLEEAAGRLRAHGTVHHLAADLTRPEQAQVLLRETQNKLGGADILVHSAGITGKQGDFLEASDEDWLQAIDTNLFSAVRMARGVIPGMRHKGWGRIVLIASEDAVQPLSGRAAVLRQQGRAAQPRQRAVQALCAGRHPDQRGQPRLYRDAHDGRDDGKRAAEKGTSFEDAIQSFLKEERPTLELRRRGEPEEVAAAILFLCSAQASFVNGANLRVDGGSVATMST
jgi:NAD(P)-dependent dehydrogenase (short-subunit alcohol dehydrogenase family)